MVSPVVPLISTAAHAAPTTTRQYGTNQSVTSIRYDGPKDNRLSLRSVSNCPQTLSDAVPPEYSSSNASPRSGPFLKGAARIESIPIPKLSSCEKGS